MTSLKQWALAGVFIATLMIGLTGFISTGLSTYQVTDKVDQGELQKLEKVENSTSIAQEAQRRAQQAEARSNFFTLPNIVNLLRLPFEAAPLLEQFANIAMEVLGLHHAPQQWPKMLVGSFILISIAFAFARRVL